VDINAPLKTSHPERSGGGEAGAAESKDPAQARATSPENAGIPSAGSGQALRLCPVPPCSPTHQPPLVPSASSAHDGTPLRMTFDFGRFIALPISKPCFL
jgi:hypothetical protein